MDRDDGTQTGEMGVHPLEGTGHPLPLRYDRGGVRLLCGYCQACSDMVAAPWTGMALPSAEGTSQDVAPVYHREYVVPVVYMEGIRYFALENRERK